MSNLKISQLTPGNPAQSGDVIPIDRAGANFSITAGSIAALATTAPAGTDGQLQYNSLGAFAGSTCTINVSGGIDLLETSLLTWGFAGLLGLTWISSSVLGITSSGAIGGFDGSLKCTVVNAITGFQVNSAAAAGHYLRGNGTNYVDGTIQAGDVPTLNQSTTGTAANLSGTPALPTGTTATTQTTGDNTTQLATDAFVNASISAYTAPVTSVFTRTGAVTAQAGDYTAAQVGAIALSLMTTLGDTIYESAVPAPTRLAGNTTATKMYLSQTGNGSISAAPVWAQINYADITGTTPTPPSGAVLWSALGNAGGNLTLANAGNTTTFNQTSAVAWLWANTTTATSGTTNASPLLELAANYWNGSASAQDLWTIGSSLAAGTNGNSVLTIGHSGSTGTVGLLFPMDSNDVTYFWNPAIGTPSSSNASISFGYNFVALNAQQGFLPSISLQTSGLTQVAIYSSLCNAGNGVVRGWSANGQANSAADSGISRLGAASLAIGNGTASDTTASLSFGKTIKYNGTATVRNGQSAEYASSDLTAQNAAITATTLISAPQTGAYKVSWSATITTASDISSVLGGANGFQVVYTSPTDSVVKTTVAGNSVTSSANTTGTAVGGVEVIYAKTGTNIQFSYGYTDSHTSTAMQYELHVTVEAL